jgi:hypothetical protein
MAESHEAGTAVSPGEESFADRRAVVLTPDQRVRVFVSSTREELAEERAAARRAIRRLHLIPVWHESGARPHPPRNMYRPTWSRARFCRYLLATVRLGGAVLDLRRPQDLHERRPQLRATRR